MRPTARTRLVGVIGHPVAHSLSPAMHNASFAARNLDYVYIAMDVAPQALKTAVRGLVALGFRGFNVTIPHKEGIVTLLDELDASARGPGAVNTVVIEGDRTRGFNTDGSGFLESCREAGVGISGQSVLIFGAGGAAAAIASAVLGEGAREVILVNRTASRAERLRERLLGCHPEAEVRVCPVRDLLEAAHAAGVLVNTTPLGMKDGDPVPFPEEVLEGRSVCDAVYRKGERTQLVRAARERGAKVVTGERMLLYQGVHAQKIWTSVEPDVRAMSRALEGSKV